MAATRISTTRKIGLTLGLALSISTMAPLSSFAFSSKERQMCTGDAFRLCSSEIPSIARITACMLRNKANVSPGCRAMMDQREAGANKARVAATPVEQPVATKAKPVQAAPAEPRPTTATPVEQPAATETKPVQAAPVEQKPATVTPVEQSAATGTKPVQAVPVEPKPTTAAPVEQPAATEAKPVQAASSAQKSAIAAPVEVKPVEAKSDPGGKPVKLAQRKRRHRQLTNREFSNADRAIDFALQISLAILRFW